MSCLYLIKTRGRVESGGIIANANVDVTVRFADKNGRWNFKINVVPKVLIQDGVLAMIIFKEDGEQVWNWASDYTGKSLPSDILRDKLELEISLENIFPVGRFYVNLFIRARDRSKDYAVFNNVVKFEKRASARVHKYDGGWQPNMNIAVRKK